MKFFVAVTSERRRGSVAVVEAADSFEAAFLAAPIAHVALPQRVTVECVDAERGLFRIPSEVERTANGFRTLNPEITVTVSRIL